MTKPNSDSALSANDKEFLWAPIGEGRNGLLLTVLTAFARLGIDPWDECVRLRGLPSDVALERLTALITSLPNEPALQRDSRIHATRLAPLLHGHLRSPRSVIPKNTYVITARRVWLTAAVIFLVLWLTTLLAAMQDVDVTAPTSSAPTHSKNVTSD